MPGRQPDRPGEPAEPADDLRPAGRLDRGPHELDRALAGGDVDAGPDVRPARVSHARRTRPPRAGRAAHGPRAGSSSSMNLRLAGVVRDGLRVVAVEAGEAEPLVRQVERREDAARSRGSRANRRR